MLRRNGGTLEPAPLSSTSLKASSPDSLFFKKYFDIVDTDKFLGQTLMAVNAVNLAWASRSPKPAAQNMPALKHVFQTIGAESCPRSHNFHMHTTFSDGHLKPEELIEQAIAIGLKGLAITDHHSVGGYQVAQRWLDDRQKFSDRAMRPAVAASPLPHLWTGVEINADLLGCEVHILGYAFDPQHPHMEPYLQGKAAAGSNCHAGSVISAIHSAGGLAVLAHPARYRIPATQLVPAAAELGIDAAEAYYAYNNPKPWCPSPKQTEQVLELSAACNLLTTCGTDTHGRNLLQRL